MSDIQEDPLAGEKETYHFLTQETRYLILQYILGHPENLPSLEELAYVVPKGKSTIHEHLDKLRERDVVDAYELETGERSRDLPSTFYGLTEYGIYLLEEFDLLQGKPILQAMYANMDKPEEIRRYQEAPRPERKSREELEAELAETVSDDDADPQEAARRVAGVTNLLERESDDSESVPADVTDRLRLGSELVELLDSGSEDDRTAAVSALARIGESNPELVRAVLPESGQTEVAELRERLSGGVAGSVASSGADESPESKRLAHDSE